MFTSAIILSFCLQETALADSQDHPQIAQTWTETVCWEDTIVIHRPGPNPILRYSLDGGASFSDPIPFDWTIHLDAGSFDPLKTSPDLSMRLQDSSESKYWIMQFQGPLLEPWLEELQSKGGKYIAMVSVHTHVFRFEDPSRAVADHPFVRWSSPYHSAYRLGKDGLSRTLESESAKGHSLDASYLAELWGNLRIHLSGGGEHVSFAPNGMSGLSAKTILGGEYVNQQGYEGQAGPNSTEPVRGMVMDGRNQQMNPNVTGLTNREFYGLSGPWVDGFGLDWHGARVFSCVFSDGSSNSGSVSALPGGEGYWIPQSEWSSSLAEIFRYLQDDNPQPPTIKACFWTSSASLFTGSSTGYNTAAKEVDEAYFHSNPTPGDDRGISLVYLTNNLGLTTPMMADVAWAKNAISVGGMRNDSSDVSYLNLSDDYWGGTSPIASAGHGPSANGRIKPDVVSYNSGIGSAQPNSSGGWNGANFVGTSAATPNVASHVGLLYQLWGEGVFNNPITGNTYFESRPPASMIKALLVHSTVAYTNHVTAPTNLDDPSSISRDRQGWGVPNLEHLFRRKDNLVYRDESHYLQLAERHTFYVQTTPAIVGTPDEFRATLVYTDYPSEVGAFSDLQFDFTLRVVDEAGNVYWGNHGLVDREDGAGGTIYATNSSEPVVAGDPKRDIANNVENVWIPEIPANSKLRVDVFCDQMGVPGSLVPHSAGFSMALSPCTELAITTNTIQLSGPETVTVGETPTFTFSGAPANAPYWLNSSSFDAGYWLEGHPFDLGPTYQIEDTGTTSSSGAGSWTAPTIPGSMAGSTIFLEVGVKHNGVWTESNMLTVSIL